MRTLIVSILGTVALAAAAFSSAVPAQAEGDLVVCTGSVTVTYSPPLGPLPQETTQGVTEQLGTDGGGCTGPYPGGTAHTVFTQEVGCLLQGLGDTLVQNVVTYHWQGGATSTITYPVTTVVHAAGQEIVTSTGTVTAGYGVGAVSERIAVYPSLDLLTCLSADVTQQTGILTLTIT
jgi:hypothetical protein